MDALWADVRYAARSLRRSPAFALAAILTLALGIGGTTVIFSIINAVLLRPLPVEEPGRLIALTGTDERGRSSSSFSYPEYLRFRDEGRALAGLAAFSFESFSLRGPEGPVAVAGSLVSGNYFDVLRVRPAVGRFFLPEEGARGAAPVAVLSWAAWQSRFAGDPGIVGRAVVLNGKPVTVVGVAPRGFGGTINVLSFDLWLPLEAYPQLVASFRLDHPGHSFLQLAGRLAPGATIPQARSELAGRLRAPFSPEGRTLKDVRVAPLTGLPGEGRAGVMGAGALLMTVALLVLFIACVNVVGMLLARASVRRREVAIRLAVGAGRGRLVRQLLTESVLLWLLGGAAGLLLASWLGRAIPALLPPLPEAARLALDLGVDARVLAFALGISLLSGVGFGLAPALQATRPGAVPALRSGGQVEGRRGSRLRDAFVVGQLAVALLLLVSAGLFLRSLWHSRVADPGFDPDGVVAAGIDLDLHGYKDDQGRAFFHQLAARLREVPGVESVGLATAVPLSGMENRTTVTAGGTEERSLGYTVVSPGYLKTLRIPLLRGRDFADADAPGAPPVVIVSEALAREYWPGQDPVGKQLRTGAEPMEVIGVVRDVQDQTMGQRPSPFMYLPLTQSYEPAATVLVRGRGGPGAALAAVRREVHALDPNLPLMMELPLRQMIVSLAPQPLLATLIGGFGVVGLILASVGVYGVVAYLVAQRTKEIGIRMALGAARRDVLRLVMGRGARLALVGMAIGTAAALGLTRFLRGLLVGVTPADPATFAGVVILLGAVVLLASWLPARRAARVDPMTALRSE
jgi:predicted permease